MRFIDFFNGYQATDRSFKAMYKGLADLADNLKYGILDVGNNKIVWGMDVELVGANLNVNAGVGIKVVDDASEFNEANGFDAYQFIPNKAVHTLDIGTPIVGENFVEVLVAYSKNVVFNEDSSPVLSFEVNTTGTGFALASFDWDGSVVSNVQDLRDIVEVRLEDYLNDIADLQNQIDVIEDIITPLSSTFLIDSSTTITAINSAVQSGSYSDFVLIESITISDEILIGDVKDILFTSLNNEKYEIVQTDNTKAVFNIVTTGSYGVENIGIKNLVLSVNSNNASGSPIYGSCVANGARNINIFNCDLANSNTSGAYCIYTEGIEGVLLLNNRASGNVSINDSVGSIMINTIKMPSAVSTSTFQAVGMKLVNIGGDITGGVRNLRGDESYLVVDKLQIIEDLLVDGGAMFNGGISTGFETFKFDYMTISVLASSWTEVVYAPPSGYSVVGLYPLIHTDLTNYNDFITLYQFSILRTLHYEISTNKIRLENGSGGSDIDVYLMIILKK